MNIWALEGHKVKVTEDTICNGNIYDKDKIKRLCQIGVEYTVDRTVVHSSSTTIYLKEFPGKDFNSVNFEDVIEQSAKDNRFHDDWSYWND